MCVCVWTDLALGVGAVCDQAALHDGPGAVQQGAELRLGEEPPQHLLPGPRAEPPAHKTPETIIKTLAQNVRNIIS